MNNQDFDRIWQEAEASGMAHRMAQEYPAWARRRQRVRNGIVAMMCIVALSATTIPLLLPQRHDDYIAVCCNRAGTNDAQWVDLAADMLITEMI
jgi:hypothetical protein